MARQMLTGLLLAFNVPAKPSVVDNNYWRPGSNWYWKNYRLVVWGNNIFNPALGRKGIYAHLLPGSNDHVGPTNSQSGIDAVTSATPLALIKESLKAGKSVSENFA